MSSRALATIPDFGPYMSLCLDAHQKYLDGDCTGALNEIGAALLIARGAGDSRSEWFLLYCGCAALAEMGRHDEVIDTAHELLDQIGEGDPVWRAKVLAMLATSLVAMSRTAQAVDAVSEAAYLLDRHDIGTYNHMSATFALSLALQPLRNFLLASDRLTEVMRRHRDFAFYITSEMALLQANWGAALQLAGAQQEAREHFLECLSATLHMRQAGIEAGDTSHFGKLRGLVFDAFVSERLGEPERAQFLLLQVPDEDLRADYPEHDLAYVTVGRVAVHLGLYDRAREHYNRVIEVAERTGRHLWRAVALDAMADLELTVHGQHPSAAWFREQLLQVHQHSMIEGDARAQELRERALVRQLRETSDQMSQAALLDPLTGVANRRALGQWSWDADGEHGAVFVDVDHFKQVNERFSHELGDRALQQVARLLSSCCRETDLVARYGGDEFVIVCAGGAKASETVAARVHESIRDHDVG